MNKIVVIEGQVSLENLVKGEVNLNNMIDGESGTFYLASAEAHETYNGNYNVIPSAFEDITLNTNNKIMQRDVTVSKIPYYQTSNTNGVTIYIADL